MLRHERDNRIVALALERIAPIGISQKLKVPVGTVYGVIKRARREWGIDIPRFPGGQGASGARFCRIPPEALPALDAAARARGLDMRELSAAILKTVAADAMIDAVLDDAVSGCAEPKPSAGAGRRERSGRAPDGTGYARPAGHDAQGEAD